MKSVYFTYNSMTLVSQYPYLNYEEKLYLKVQFKTYIEIFKTFLWLSYLRSTKSFAEVTALRNLAVMVPSSRGRAMLMANLCVKFSANTCHKRKHYKIKVAYELIFIHPEKKNSLLECTVCKIPRVSDNKIRSMWKSCSPRHRYCRYLLGCLVFLVMGQTDVCMDTIKHTHTHKHTHMYLVFGPWDHRFIINEPIHRYLLVCHFTLKYAILFFLHMLVFQLFGEFELQTKTCP